MAYARMVELVDTTVLRIVAYIGVRVRVPLRVLKYAPVA